MIRLHHVLALGSAAWIAASGPATAQTSSSPSRGGTFVYAVTQGEPATLDCHVAISINVSLRIAPHYSSLLKSNPSDPSQIMGDLARSWTVSKDGKTLSFKLHPNVRFHDGSPLTASDVKFSLDRIRNPPKGMLSPREPMLADVSSIETPDRETVVIRLAATNASFLKVLANPTACIISEAMAKADPDYPGKKVMGSGPFKFVRYSPGHEWVGERFDQYFVKDRPYLDGFRALSMPVPAAINALSAGQVMTDFRGVANADAVRIKAARGDKVRVHEAKEPINLLLMYMVNGKKPDLADVRVRRAIALALDHWGGEKLVERSTGTSAPGGLLRPGSAFARSPEELSSLPGFRRDMEAARAEARKLLAEAGKTNLTLRLLNRKPFPYAGVFLIDQLRQIGITVTQEQPEDPQYIAKREAGDFDLMLGAFPDMDDDPTVQWSALTSDSVNARIYASGEEKRVDAFYLSQKQASTPQQRKAILQEAEAWMLNQAYVIPFFWGRRTVVMSTEVGGYSPTHSNWVGLDLADLWLRK